MLRLLTAVLRARPISPAETLRSGCRSSSYFRCAGQSASASAQHITAPASSPPCQPLTATAQGRNRPANMPPNGTPVCLIENTSGAAFAVANRARIWLEAGVLGPIASPRKNAATGNSQSQPSPHSIIPTPAAVRQYWLTRNAPKRRITPPLATAATMPVPNSTLVKTPSRPGLMPNVSAIGGSSTGTELLANVISVCCTSIAPATTTRGFMTNSPLGIGP